MTDLPALRELLRRSVLTLAAVPDSDLRYRLGPRPHGRNSCAMHGTHTAARHHASARSTQPARISRFTSRRCPGWPGTERTYGEETVRVFRGLVLRSGNVAAAGTG